LHAGLHLAELVAAAEPPVSIAGPDSGFATLERVLELLGLFVFAISGGMLAVRKGFEVVGVTALAGTTALGGGIIRDLVLGDSPPVAFRDVWYLVVPLSAAVVVFVGHRWISSAVHRSVLVFDAAGLGLFTVTGAVKAASFGTTAVGAVLLAVVTAVGGGILRDVLANDQPQLFQAESRLYAIPAAVGATIVVATVRNDVYSGVIGAGVAAAVFAVRVAALHFGWRAPRPRT
jgi:uncharacterized membrane protein YeiH